MAYDNGNDTSEENRATVQKLNTQLDAAEKDLEQTEYDKYIQDQQELLDQFYTTLEEWLNGRLDQIEGLFEEAIAETNLNAQLIDDTLHETAESVSYQMTDEFTRIWDNLATSYEISDGIATVSQGILDITQGVTESIRYKMDELPTETNLESFFEGENLRLLNELSNVENNMYNMNSAIDSTTRAIDNVSSNIAELSNVVGNKIDYAGNSVVNAINSLEFSTGGSGYDAPSDGNYNTNSNSGNNYSDSSNRRSTSDYSRYRIEGYDERGIAITRDYGNDYQTAQHELEKLRKKGGAGRLIPYAKGGIVGKDKNFLDSIAQLLGEDHMIAAKEGERVLTEDQNKSFEKMVNANFSPLEGSAKDKYSMLSGIGGKGISSTLANIPTPEIGNLTNVGNTTTVGDINITLPNVTNKEEFVNWLKNDGQIERIIQAFTIDRLNGGNSYGKMRF